MTKQKGFTLLEVLLASFILFLALTAMTMVYQGALTSSRVADRSIAVHQIVGFATADIKKRLADGPELPDEEVSGGGRVGEISFSWKASKVLDSRGQTILGADGDFVRPDTRYQIWAVTLTLKLQGYRKPLQYRIFRWQEK
ncbi:type IV pilus modification PilV family protein [Shewanella waksmanii]|uniref:type IV pilus modification PilV family protein n=1 Tax=Shewanella waksmanii TaxID=213783 RepID=UPI0004B31909|nr:prepilin-type N-terminal cleavage/methylation domain-containing protein [Shewanella waksmanii]